MAELAVCYGRGHRPHAKGECPELVTFTLRRCLCPIAKAAEEEPVRA